MSLFGSNLGDLESCRILRSSTSDGHQYPACGCATENSPADGNEQTWHAAELLPSVVPISKKVTAWLGGNCSSASPKQLLLAWLICTSLLLFGVWFGARQLTDDPTNYSNGRGPEAYNGVEENTSLTRHLQEDNDNTVSSGVVALLASLFQHLGQAPGQGTETLSISTARCPVMPPLPGKKGVGFTMRDEGESGSWVVNLPRVIALRPHWNYNWGTVRIDEQPDDIEFIPMLWGGNNIEKLQQRLQDDVLPHIQSGKVKRLLGFNEPDRKKQSNMDVSTALDRWPLLEDTNLPLVSPSCASADGEWMNSFMDGIEEMVTRSDPCRGQVDWIGVHWYGGPSFNGFTNEMRSIYDRHGGRPLLITEFAPADWSAKKPEDNRHTPETVLAFMKLALPWLEEQNWIAGYAWFPFDITSPQGTSSALFDLNDDLTALGRFYVSVSASKPNGDQSIGR